MAGVVAERIWRDTLPEAIERDLAAVWSDLGRRMPIARALMANLIVVCQPPTDEPFDLALAVEDPPVDEVSRLHPSRVIVLHHVRGQAQPCGPAAAAVGVLTFGPPEGRYGIEQIVVRAACADASLPSIVRRLTLGDLPTSLWWAEDLSRATPLEPLVRMGRQLIYDSRGWHDVRRGVVALESFIAGPQPLDLADLNWRRLLPMRQALVHAMEAADSPPDVLAVHVRHRRGEAALAWLLVGWLSARGAISDADTQMSIIEGDSDDILSVAFRDTAITAVMNDTRVLATFRPNTPPLAIAVPQETTPDAVAAELRNLRRDVCLHDTLLALAHFSGRGFSR